MSALDCNKRCAASFLRCARLLCSIEIEYHVSVRNRWFLAMALLVPALAEARSADEVPSQMTRSTTAVVVVDLTTAPGARAWLADAFEQTMSRELSGFERLSTVAKEDFATRDCGIDTTCRLRIYKQAHIDIVFFGVVADTEIQYELYQTWTPARIATGAIAIGRPQSALGLKHETRDAFHPVLKHGGLLDQRPYTYTPGSSLRQAVPGGALGLVGLGALAMALLPFVLVAVRTASVRRVAALRSARWVAAVALAAAVIALVIAVGGAVFDLASPGELVASWRWGFAGIAGLAWGALAITTVRRVLPPLDGVTRVAYHDVFRIVRTWCVVAAQRVAVLAGYYAGLAWLSLWLGDQLAIPDPWRIILLVPATWWLARLVLASWVECLAAWIDDRLVDGVASSANPWSREIADYLMGYVRRTGWDVDRNLLARVLFLPGKDPGGAVSYGGGATHARVVIDKALLELTMGALVEIKPDEPPALWPDWTIATVVPAAGARVRRAAGAAVHRGGKPHAAAHIAVRKPLGQPATLLGYVVASPGELVPLISDNPHDLAVVRALLSEHYPWDAPDPDDEFDPTDPTDKDLLFGVLVRELGAIQRQDCQLETLKLALGRRVAGLGSRAQARLADLYPALNFARDHLVQYLHYRWSGTTDLLTARARSDRLHDTSIQILRQLREPPEPRRGRARGVRRRLIWLSWFFTEPIVDRWDTWSRRLVAVCAIAALVAVAGVIARQSIDYHPIYVERIEAWTLAQRRAAARHTDPSEPPASPEQPVPPVSPEQRK
jgi:hypothetical protein